MIHFRTLHVPKDHQCPTCNKDMTLKQYNSHKNYCNQDYVYCDFCCKRFSNPKYLKTHCKNKHFEETMKTKVIDDTLHSLKIDKDSGIQDVKTITWAKEPPEMEPIVKTEIKTTTEMVESYLMEEQEEEAEQLDEIEYTEIETIEEETQNQVTYEIIYEREEQENEEEVPEYRCSITSSNVETLDQLNEDINLRHKDSDRECLICHKVFTKTSLQRHMRYHDKKNICPKCGRGFSELGLLKAHMDRKFSCLGPTLKELQQDPTYMLKEYPCDLCLYRGATKSHLKRHIRNKHYVEEKEIECPECGKELTRQQWQSHRKTHIKVKCQICQKWFSDSKFFKIHLENHAKPATERQKTARLFNIHEPSTGGSYNCPECSFQTKERRFLIQHLKVKHAPKDFECQFEECSGKKFTQTQLRLHQRFHRLAFKCEKCGTGFPDSRDLKRHIDGKKCFKIRKSRMVTKGSEKESKKEVCRKQKREKRSHKIKTEIIKKETDIGENLHETTVFNYKSEPQIIHKKNNSVGDSLSPTINRNSSQKRKLPVSLSPSTVILPEVLVNPCFYSITNAVGTYECPDCNFETDDKPELTEHWNHFHAPRDQPCPETQCYGKLFSKAQLKLHMRFHLNKAQPSGIYKNLGKKQKKIIGPKFTRNNVSLKAVLTRNLRIVNMSENAWIYRCSGKYQNCDFMTVDKKQYNTHQVRVHKWKAAKRTQDKVVSKVNTVAKNNDLSSSENVNVLRGPNICKSFANVVFKCGKCDFETNKEVYLQQHEQMNHSGKGWFSKDIDFC